MREIKYRALSTNNKDWIYGFPLLYGFENWIVDAYGRKRNIKPETVGQYTGLKDKNGQAIYEGDILTTDDYPFQIDGKYNYHGVIEWIDVLASFYMTKVLANSKKRGISDGISEQIDDISDFEVIGNIHENPELLEVPE